MARYRVTTPRFYGKGKNAALYGPGTSRLVLTVDKPYPKDSMPDGLVLIVETKSSAPVADRDKVKAAMLEMIKDNDNLGTDGIPNMAPLNKKLKFKAGSELRDELMKEISAEKAHKQGLIESGQKVSFTDNDDEEKSKVTTL